MKKTVVILMLLTFISKILGFARDIILSYFYGATIISDVYLISITIPVAILAIIGKGIYTAFVPMYTRIESSDGIDRANNYTNNLMNVVAVLCTFIFIVGVVFTELLVKLFASGFEGEALTLAVIFTRINLIGVFFTGVIYVFTSFLQKKEIFFIPAIMGLPANLIVIVSIFISSKTNIYLLPIGNLLATVSQFLLLLFYANRSNYRYKFTLDLKDKNIRKMSLLALPVIFGSSISQINVLIDRTLASSLAPGGISALNYANTINLVVLGMLVSAITSVLYPKISTMIVENNMMELKKNISMTANVIHLLVLPITVGYMIFSHQIVQLLFGRGAFDSQAMLMTSNALFFYSIGLAAISLREMLSNIYYSLQDTKTPMSNAVLAMILNIILNFALAPYLGIGGLALASSISMIFCTVLLFISLRKKIGNFGTKTIIISFIKTLAASIIMGGASLFIYERLSHHFSFLFSFLSSIVIGMVVYCIVISFMKMEEVKIMTHDLQNKMKLTITKRRKTK